MNDGLDFGLGDSTPGASPVWSSPSKSDEDDGKYALGLDHADAAVGAVGEKLVLEFSNVDFAVEPSARILSVFADSADSGVDVKQILLRSVHGTASPGGVLGILGKSGAGKSLLHLGKQRAGRRLAHAAGENEAQLAQKLGQLQPLIALFSQECMGQLAFFGPT